jgi:hypothetical protein
MGAKLGGEMGAKYEERGKIQVRIGNDLVKGMRDKLGEEMGVKLDA